MGSVWFVHLRLVRASPAISVRYSYIRIHICLSISFYIGIFERVNVLHTGVHGHHLSHMGPSLGPITKDVPSFGTWMAARMAELGLTQEAVAQVVINPRTKKPVSQGSVSDWANDIHPPTGSKIRDLAKVLGVTVGEILDRLAADEALIAEESGAELLAEAQAYMAELARIDRDRAELTTRIQDRLERIQRLRDEGSS